MSSIYKQLDKIDDSKSLNEKWNVKNQREVEYIKEDIQQLDETSPLVKEIQEYIHNNIFGWESIGFTDDHIYVEFEDDEYFDDIIDEINDEFKKRCDLEFDEKTDSTLLIRVSVSDEINEGNWVAIVEDNIDYACRAKFAEISYAAEGFDFIWVSQEHMSDDDAYQVAKLTNDYLASKNHIGKTVTGTCYCRSYPEDDYKVKFVTKQDLQYTEIEDATMYEYGIIDDSEYFEEEYTTDWNEALETFNNTAHNVQARLVDMDDEEYEDYYSDGVAVRMIKGKEGSDAFNWDTIREVIVFRDHIENEEELEEQLITEGTRKTYRYPKGSPITRFDRAAGNTTEDFETTEESLAKARNNIVYKIKQRYNLTGNVKIDSSKLIIIGGYGDSSGTGQIKTSQPVEQNEPEQLKLDI